MKILLLIICVLFISCTKEKPLPELQFISDGQEINFDCYNTKVEPFCGTQNIYSITAGDLLISIVADSLVNGKYDAGMNYWGNYTEVITLNVSKGAATSCRQKIAWNNQAFAILKQHTMKPTTKQDVIVAIGNILVSLGKNDAARVRKCFINAMTTFEHWLIDRPELNKKKDN